MANNQQDSTESLLLKSLAGLLKEVGIPGFVVLSLVLIFIRYATEEQKRQFIDQYFLLKNIGDNPYPFFLLVIILFVVAVGQNIYYRKRLDLAERENERIGKEKSELQTILLDRQLRSSQ